MSGTVERSAGNPPFTSSTGACFSYAFKDVYSCPSSDGLPPYAETQLASFNPTQPYDLSLHLVVPATPSNYDLGNFMTTLTLTGPSNKTLTTIRKPVSPLADHPFASP
jgi:Putative adipose-regulatory protein (Seipin)